MCKLLREIPYSKAEMEITDAGGGQEVSMDVLTGIEYPENVGVVRQCVFFNGNPL